jgi:cobalt/nickel transport system permease protein
MQLYAIAIYCILIPHVLSYDHLYKKEVFMHIPDGFINTPVAATTAVIAVAGIAYAVKETNKKIGEKQIPMMGVLGAALAAILLGPWAGMLVMSCVLIVQCLVFQDGGLLALGANIFNMGIVGGFVSYYIYRGINFVFKDNKAAQIAGGGIAAWFSVVIASIFCAFELAISGTSPLGIALPAMAGIHTLIGIVEGVITAAVLSIVLATRADLLQLQKV